MRSEEETEKKKELSSDAFQQLLVPKKKLGAGIIIA
jgi:hypothetical protein